MVDFIQGNLSIKIICVTSEKNAANDSGTESGETDLSLRSVKIISVSLQAENNPDMLWSLCQIFLI